MNSNYNINSWVNFTLVLCSAICLFSCAKQGTLSGGPRDLIPPRIDPLLSEANYQTKFFPQKIELHFDEWIQLKNKSQILVSPPLEYNPKIDTRGKKVEIVFDEREVLRDSTTYAISFGDAIVDYTESNPIENFQFIFSTGNRIDSLSVMGKVIDAFTGKAMKDVTVMLYKNFADSVVYEEKPYYFSKTNKEGLFHIKYLRGGKFKCFALKDEDYNYLYNQESEQIGFPDSLITVKSDSLLRFLDIELFLPTPEFNFTEYDIVKRGKFKLIHNTFNNNINLEYANIPLIESEFFGDSTILWYNIDTTKRDSLYLILQVEDRMDTLEIGSKKNTPEIKKVRFSSFKMRTKKVLPDEEAEITFDQIIQSVDTSFFEWSQEVQKAADDSTGIIKVDSLVVLDYKVQIDSVNPRNLKIWADLTGDKAYKLTFYPGAVNGFYFNTNDTLKSVFSLESVENLGSIICTFDSLDIEQQYVIQLKQKSKMIREHIIFGVDSLIYDFNLLPAGKYQLEIIEDDTKNGRWDPGNYLEKRQSERKIEIQLEELRKDWNIETTIKWDKK